MTCKKFFMIDRNVRKRLLMTLKIIHSKPEKYWSVKDIINEMQKIDSWFNVERRAIYEDMAALEEFGLIVVIKRRYNKNYGKAVSPVLLHFI